MIESHTEVAGSPRQQISVGAHQLFADMLVGSGGAGSAPDAHDLFDASLAACKALTAHWYAKQRGFPLERVTTQVERDASHEKEGRYGLTVTLQFHGPLTDEQRARLHDVVGRCPVHKLMTSTEITITTKQG
ncbi:MAG: OsmC family protein [Archangium sp.]|nr:OsmC family protein [Archangium sp.]